MIDARNLASQGFPTGTLIVTSYQVAGRGRFPDRKWESNPGESLLCTLILRTADVPDPLAPLSLKTALAIATLLEEEFQLKPAIKWPNDVLLNERKVAGILAETKEQSILIGIGINCLQKSFPKELRNTATSIRKASGNKFEIQDLISPLLTHLHRWIFASSSEASHGLTINLSWKTELENRLYRRNDPVWFLPGIPGQEEPFAGTILGITEEGLLLIKPEGSAEIRELAAGEILFRTKK